MDHLTDGEMAGYLDRTITRAARARVEDHLAACDDCRAELVSASRALEAPPAASAAPAEPSPPVRSPLRRRVLPFAAAVAAVAAVALLMVRRDELEAPARSSPLRSSATDAAPATAGGAPRFAIVAPASGTRLAPGAIRFVWRTESSGAAYRLTLSAEDGSVRWTHDTPDTTAALADTVALAPGTYFWYVDALRTDGRSATSGAHPFLVGP